jgi:PAS domain S-box-containing protein
MKRPSAATGYLISLATVLAAVLLRWLLDALMGDTLPLVTLFGAVAVAVWLGGYRPALLAAVLGYVACAYLFMEPRGGFGFEARDLIGVLAYLVTCSIIIGFGEAMRVAQRRWEELVRQQERLLPPTSTGIEHLTQKYSLRALVVIGFGHLLAVLVIGGLLGYVNVRVLSENEQQVAHTHEVIGELESLLSAVTDAETGQRGYLLTEDEQYLQPYEDASKRVDATVALLKQLIHDPGQQARLAVLEQRIGIRRDELKRTVALMKARNRPAAMEIVRSNTGKAMMDDLRERVAAMRKAHEELLGQRTASSEASFRTTVISLLLTVVIGVVLVCVVFYLSQRNLLIRQRAAEAMAEQRERLRVTLTSIGDAVITTDVEGCIAYMNAVAESLTGWTQGEAAGKSLGAVFNIVNEETRKAVENPAQRALQEGIIVGLASHTILVRKDGTELPIDDTAACIRDAQGHVLGCVLVFRDITNRKEIERDREERAAQLAVALGKRTEEARRAEKAEQLLLQADRRKDEFLATLAHELRNPLAPLRNALELLRRSDDKALFEQARCMMERQVSQMVRLVDDLLDISRITEGKLQLRKDRVELADVLNAAIETARPLIGASGHELTVTMAPQPVHVQADPIRLAQAFSNLLNNAAKYTEKAGHIWVTTERNGNEAVVSVRDTGIGIAGEHMAHLFKMFSQMPPALERSQGGLGIGLSLVKGLVELHGGTIEARSAGPGKGSEFKVHLPIVDVPLEAPQQPSGSETMRRGPKCRILVVDDLRDSADSMAMILETMGHETRTAYDGLEAVQTAAAFRPNIALVDIGLPKMNGYDVARHIRSEPWGGNVALVALTGWGQEEDKRRSLEAGFDHHLTKPVEAAVLEKLLAGLAPIWQR